jgi:kumamolisin
MAFETKVQLPGSAKKAPSHAQKIGEVEGHSTVSVTVLLRRAGTHPAIAAEEAPPITILSRTTFSERHGASKEDLKLVEKFAHHANLTVVDSSVPKRRVILSGTAAAMASAFGVEFSCYKSDDTGHTFRGRTGTIQIPAELQGAVVGVIGLDNRPVAKPHFRTKKKKPAASATFTPPQVAALYQFPKGLTGAGQTVAIIELGGGYKTADLQTYFQGLGVTEPNVVAVAVDGGANKPGGDADGEVLLDIEVVGAVAPGADIAVYFAPNTDQGFVDAISDAVHDATRKPSIVSISWGGPEDSWTAQSLAAMNSALQDAATLGVTVTVASGDNGSTDGEAGALHVDFPSSSPYALACGGTTLKGSGSKISSETVWNETANKEGAGGGGVSLQFPLPSYQQAAGVPTQPATKYVGRGVPDVAGNADPSTGYQVRVDGQNEVVGGTSAVAPLWAGLVALLNEKLGKPVGFLNPTLYTLGETVFQDITVGNNDDGGLGNYSAKAGWDACTGLGSPNGTALLNALAGGNPSGPGGPEKHKHHHKKDQHK